MKSGIVDLKSGPWIFDTVVTNVGNAYNDHTGLFTAPDNGIYVFNFNFVNHWDEDTVHGKLVKNGVTIAMGVAESRDFFDDGGAMATVLLEKGDEVYVTRGGLGNKILGDWWCNFSGFLLSDALGTFITTGSKTCLCKPIKLSKTA